MYILLKQVGTISAQRVKVSLALLFCFPFRSEFLRSFQNPPEKEGDNSSSLGLRFVARTCIPPSWIPARSRSKNEKMFGARAGPKIPCKIQAFTLLRYANVATGCNWQLVEVLDCWVLVDAEAERIAREIESGQMLGLLKFIADAP